MDENVQDLYPNSNKINNLFTFDTEFSADSVEWCPHEPLTNFFVCANYQLSQSETTEAPQKRVGRILLFSITPARGLELRQTLDTAAVLDQKWCHNQIHGVSVLGVVNAEKKIEIYKLNADAFQLELLTCYEIQRDDGEVLILSLDWSTGKFSTQEPEIVCSDSKGSWHRFKFGDNELTLECSHQVHDYEAWIAAFYYWDTNIFFTGGDDCLLTKFDKRQGLEPVLKNRAHDAGVTCIHSNAEKEFLLASGSYDEILRLWDIRNMKQPSDKLKMPGPLWRLKWDPFSFKYLLVACMLGGAHVVLGQNSEELKIIESYYGHKNITYGADWSHLCESKVDEFKFEGNRIVGTCSFYDHLLCVSKLCIS